MPRRQPTSRRPSRPRSFTKAERTASARRRLAVLLVVMVLALGAIAVKTVSVQALSGEHYDELALAQRVRSMSLAAERGSIFDRNGNDLAISVQQQTVFADPRFIRDPAVAVARLAPVLGLEPQDLLERLSRTDTAFVYLARKVNDETAKQVRTLGITGVGMVGESKRFYPSSSLAAPVLGFVGTDNNGLGGLEASFEATLRGKPGKVVTEADPSGRSIPTTDRTEEQARRGGDLVLTLDQSIQYETERQLVAQVEATKARGGMAVVADVRTGDVLAMVTVVGADADGPARPASSTQQNRPVTTVYEPGSTNKVITLGAALEAGVVTPDTTYAVGSSIRIADAVFDDHDPHPVEQWSVRDIMRESSNVGTILVARALGKERLDASLRAFGFGSRTALDFPGESAGLLLDPSRYSLTSMGSVPVGNGLAVTAMQMLDVFVTVANGGVSRPPRLVSATIDADGTKHPRRPLTGTRVVSATTAAQLNEMLRSVVSDGTGERAGIPGYSVAGKTGTARKPPYEQPYRYMASFAGFAPAEAPRLAAIVVLDEPGTSYYGGQVAAPVFARVMQYALRLERVPPTAALTTPDDDASAAPSRSNDAPAPPAPSASTVTPVTLATASAARAAPGTLTAPDS
ncbi:MAG: penicillin-binding protein 2 [Actinobacteria bacterium]|nr:penicillin-binding protein 2 [Actinomycetota bacterium]